MKCVTSENIHCAVDEIEWHPEPLAGWSVNDRVYFKLL
jgi:hypothetical protein